MHRWESSELFSTIEINCSRLYGIHNKIKFARKFNVNLEDDALKMRSKIWQTRRRLDCRSFDHDSSSPCTPERTNLYLSSKEKGFYERDSFSISSLPSTRREIRVSRISLEERTSPANVEKWLKEEARRF